MVDPLRQELCGGRCRSQALRLPVQRAKASSTLLYPCQTRDTLHCVRLTVVPNGSLRTVIFNLKYLVLWFHIAKLFTHINHPQQHATSGIDHYHLARRPTSQTRPCGVETTERTSGLYHIKMASDAAIAELAGYVCLREAKFLSDYSNRVLSVEETPVKLRCATCSQIAYNALRLPCCEQNICENCEPGLNIHIPSSILILGRLQRIGG
jgi:hypothetical protein